MRTIVSASVLAGALVTGASCPSAIADDGTGEAQVRALEAQIEQLVNRVCTLEETVARLRSLGCAGAIQPATAAEPEEARPDPWCYEFNQPDTH